MSWKKMKLKYLAHMQSGDSITSESIEVEGIYPVYGGGALRGYTEIYTHDGEHILIGRQGAHCGSVREVKGKFFASEHAVVVTHSKGVDNGWLYYLLESMNLNQYSISAAQPGLSVGSIKNLEVNVPYYDLQVKIRKYIDKKTKMFESIIKQKEKLINLLEQQRQSIITEAVTKGLNPNVKMKDSGVEWIGEIPEHWDVTRLKYQTSIRGRIGFRGFTTNDLVSENEGALVLGATNMSRTNKLDLTKKTFLSWEKYYESPEIMVEKNDLLVVQRGSTVGKVSLIDKILGDVTINPSLILIKNSKVDTRYLYWYLCSGAFKRYLEPLISTTAIPMISQEQLSNLYLILPNNDEIIQIINHIKEKVKKIDELIGSINNNIEKLKEYRQSLIYEAVTGKIDVRDMELD